MVWRTPLTRLGSLSLRADGTRVGCRVARRGRRHSGALGLLIVACWVASSLALACSAPQRTRPVSKKYSAGGRCALGVIFAALGEDCLGPFRALPTTVRADARPARPRTPTPAARPGPGAPAATVEQGKHTGRRGDKTTARLAAGGLYLAARPATDRRHPTAAQASSDARELIAYLALHPHGASGDARELIAKRYDDLTHALDERLGLQPTRETLVMYWQLFG